MKKFDNSAWVLIGLMCLLIPAVWIATSALTHGHRLRQAVTFADEAAIKLRSDARFTNVNVVAHSEGPLLTVKGSVPSALDSETLRQFLGSPPAHVPIEFKVDILTEAQN
jgi:hypothetical protein